MAEINKYPASTQGDRQDNLFKDIIIRKAHNGFIVEVGCKTFVFNKLKDVTDGLESYYKDPIAAEKFYLAINSQ